MIDYHSRAIVALLLCVFGWTESVWYGAEAFTTHSTVPVAVRHAASVQGQVIWRSGRSGKVPSTHVVQTIRTRCMATRANNDELVDLLLNQMEQRGNSHIGDATIDDCIVKATIDEIIQDKATVNVSDDDIATQHVDFDDLIGYYNVSLTLTARPKDNPVGGKWTRNGSTRHLWVIRRTLQHILPKRLNGLPEAVAQAVNVIRLDLLFGLIPVWIVLRGDAVPLDKDDDDNNPNKDDDDDSVKSKSKSPTLLPNLSRRAVRAYFDRPRIAIGKWIVLSLGPTSSVVLDTPYIDSRIRIGKGGTSGTLFVFRRIDERQDTEATSEWTWLLDESRQPSFVTKTKAGWWLGSVALGSAVATKIWQQGLVRTISTVGIILSLVGLLWVALGTGGIETRGDTYARGK